jgi:hypothetical protein
MCSPTRSLSVLGFQDVYACRCNCDANRQRPAPFAKLQVEFKSNQSSEQKLCISDVRFY